MKKKIKGRVIKVYCANCETLLYKYFKAGPGHLIKCHKDRIVKDFTNGDLRCSKCGKQFARDMMIRGKLANKIIQGKVFTRG